jgi:hypothetical protein
MKETNYIHIHKGNEIQSNTKTYCKIELNQCKQGAVRFANRSFATCPHCLTVATKTENLLGV